METYVVIGVVIAFCIVLCLCLAIASFSFDNYYAKLQEVDKSENSAKITTFQYVQEINKKHFKGSLRLTKCAQFEDHYSTGEISLSEQTISSNSLASLAIISHELGHARQDFSGSKLKQHWKLRKTGKTFGLFFMPLVFIGVVLSLLNILSVLKEELYLYIGFSLICLGLLIFIFAIFLKYKEIQIEKEASRYALSFLEEILTSQEVAKCKEFLNSARLTYWGSLFRTMFGWTLLTRKEKMFK